MLPHPRLDRGDIPEAPSLDDLIPENYEAVTLSTRAMGQAGDEYSSGSTSLLNDYSTYEDRSSFRLVYDAKIPHY